MRQDHLLNNLEKLNEKLKKENIFIEIHAIGGFALFLHNIDIQRMTVDIDNVKEISDERVKELIHEVGEEGGQDNWFDFSASSLSLPDDYQERLVQKTGHSNINIFVLSLRDIVQLKIAAFYHRRLQGNERDLSDLIQINPTMKGVKEGLEFIRYKHGSHLTGKFLKELESDLKELEDELSELFE